jgi:hypothetical protein
MSHTASDTVATVGTVGVNILTWSDVVLPVLQSVLTVIVTVAMIVYYAYMIVDRHRTWKKNNADDNKA